MRKCARAIVVKDKNILVMERHKQGRHYFTLPGGTVEANETPEQAALREVAEETSLVIADPKLMFIEHADSVFGDQHVFLCSYVSGSPALSPTSEELRWSVEGKNTYAPQWMPIDKLKDIEFVSPLLKEALLLAFAHGFPNSPYEFSSRHAERLS